MTSAAPAIAPVPGSEPRPLWSVMIPTYNCAAYLRETLAGVLAQAPGPDRMQIEVIDDCSTKDDPEAVVREFAPDGRVAFFRQPANGGVVNNFNTCIARSRGHLVHLLHGDDKVLPGFYRSMEAAFDAHPGCALVAARSFVIDQAGELQSLSGRYPDLEQPTARPRSLFRSNEFFTPGVVVRRSAYERNGGYRPDLVHVADWEMWLRQFTLGQGMMLNEPLACYRMHGANDTSRLARTAENLRDYLRLGVYAAEMSPDFSLPVWRKQVGLRARHERNRFLIAGDGEAAAAHARLWRELTPGGLRLLQILAIAVNDRVNRWST